MGLFDGESKKIESQPAGQNGNVISMKQRNIERYLRSAEALGQWGSV
jgi:hypothetical protein